MIVCHPTCSGGTHQKCRVSGGRVPPFSVKPRVSGVRVSTRYPTKKSGVGSGIKLGCKGLLPTLHSCLHSPLPPTTERRSKIHRCRCKCRLPSPSDSAHCPSFPYRRYRRRLPEIISSFLADRRSIILTISLNGNISGEWSATQCPGALLALLVCAHYLLRLIIVMS
jgi:hypothetical protein